MIQMDYCRMRQGRRIRSFFADVHRFFTFGSGRCATFCVGVPIWDLNPQLPGSQGANLSRLSVSDSLLGGPFRTHCTLLDSRLQYRSQYRLGRFLSIFMAKTHRCIIGVCAARETFPGHCVNSLSARCARSDARHGFRPGGRASTQAGDVVELEGYCRSVRVAKLRWEDFRS